MWDIPDHPDIDMAIKTGYPSWNQPEEINCDYCGDAIDCEVYEDENHETLCLYCLLRLHLKED